MSRPPRDVSIDEVRLEIEKTVSRYVNYVRSASRSPVERLYAGYILLKAGLIVLDEALNELLDLLDKIRRAMGSAGEDAGDT